MIKRNEDIVHLYLMTSRYAGEEGKVKMGIAKDCDKRAEDVGGKLEMISLPQLRPLILEIEKATHSIAILRGIKKATVHRRSGHSEWFICSVEERLKTYTGINPIPNNSKIIEIIITKVSKIILFQSLFSTIELPNI